MKKSLLLILLATATSYIYAGEDSFEETESICWELESLATKREELKRELRASQDADQRERDEQRFMTKEERREWGGSSHSPTGKLQKKLKNLVRRQSWLERRLERGDTETPPATN